MRRKFLIAMEIVTIALLSAYVWVENHPPRLTLAQLRTVKVDMTLDEVERQLGEPPGSYACKGGRRGGTSKSDGITAKDGAVWITGYHKLTVRYGDDHRVSEVSLSRRPSDFSEWCVEQQRGSPLSEEDFLMHEREEDRYSWKSIHTGWRKIW